MDERGRSEQPAVARLTARQKDCLRLVGDGFTSKEIGRTLGISPATVDNHIRSSLETLRVDTRAAAARLFRAGDLPDQPLTSQPGEVANPPDQAASIAVSEAPRPWWRRMLPPVGGTPNTQNWEGNVLAVLKVAMFGFAVLAFTTLGVSILLWWFR